MTVELVAEPECTLDRSIDIAPSVAARQQMLKSERGGVFRSDWLDSVFIHLRVDRNALAGCTPFELDLFEGEAYVSLVAFHMRRFRVRGTGAIGAMLMAPAARHALLNVRTYVRHNNEPGICFLTEWIPNPLSVFLGPRLFGLPYRYGRLDYRHRVASGRISGRAGTGDHHVRYDAATDPSASFQQAARFSLDEFLLERYAAFTDVRRRRRFFRIWHEPWEFVPVDLDLHEKSLLGLTAPWLPAASLVRAHYSPGVRDVWIGPPRAIRRCWN